MTYHDPYRPLPPQHKHPGGYTDITLDPRDNDDLPSGGWMNGARGITQVRVRHQITKHERNLAQRQRAHDADPPMADGSQPNGSKRRATRPGSLSGRKH